MNARKLAKEVRSGIEWLIKEDCGCCHWPIGKGMAIAMGWHDNGTDDYVIAYKVGKITSLQCDLDWDFPMPSTEDGEVYDTCCTIVEDKKVPSAKDCYLIALDMNTAARGAKRALRDGYML